MDNSHKRFFITSTVEEGKGLGLVEDFVNAKLLVQYFFPIAL